ncbi:MAG: Fic family protein [Candidatus Hodarchaeales archaeon]
MVRILEKRKGSKKYFVLAHTIRVGKRVVRREKYLGVEVPDNLEIITANFLHELYIDKWGQKLTEIKHQYRQVLSKMSVSVLKKYYEDFEVRFTYDSNRIEGSTLTLRETASLLLENYAPSRSLQDILEAKSHQNLIKEMMRHANTSNDLNYNVILEWHHILFKDSKPDIAGKIRSVQVKIAGSDLEVPSPVEIFPLLDEFFQWYHQSKNLLHPLELAALVHYKFVSIHPFVDGNGRISRMMMNYVLFKHNYPLYSLPEKVRNTYYNILARADKKEDPYIFVNYLTRQYVKKISYDLNLLKTAPKDCT